VDTTDKYQSFLIRYHAGVARDLPVISPFALQVARQPRGRNPSLELLTQAFETDPFLAAKLTGASNSVFFARDHLAVLTVPEALRRVGIRYAINLACEAPRLPPSIEESEVALLWAHCMTVAHVAKSIAANVSSAPYEPDVAHLVAMIHDIGYLLQLNYSPNTWSDIAARLEREELGPGNDAHASQGEELAKFWSLPAAAVAAIRTHHDPQNCTDPRGRWLARVVAASEVMLHRSLDPLHLASGNWPGEVFFSELEISREVLPGLRAEAIDVFDACIRLAHQGLGTRRVPYLQVIRTGGSNDR
jgi:putative nucleotidyltransferase with HDIG domain